MTGGRKVAFMTLVTTHGVRDNEHARWMGLEVATMNALFAG